MTPSRTLWEEGHEPGPRVVALGIAVALSVVALDIALTGRVGTIFGVVFVLLCVALALLVRPSDFFTVGVLPPLVMTGTFLLVAATRPAALAHPGDGFVQAVVTGLARHALALVLGYALCLACLAVRQRVLDTRERELRTRTGPGHLHRGG